MRSCAYCGKSLEKGENCDCPQSVMARRAKNKSSDNYWYNQENVYTTGYTSEEKNKAKHKRVFKKPDTSKLKSIILRCIKDPVGMVFEMKEKSLLKLALLSVVLDITISMCFLIVTGAAFLGANNFWLLLLRASLGVILFSVLIVCIFSLINKLILRQNIKPIRLITRLTGALIPFTVISVFSAILSFFPGFADLIILLAGVIIYLITIYEVLRCEWSFLKTSQVMYLMTVGIAILFVVLFNFIRI